MLEILLEQYPFYLGTILVAIGLWGMFAKHNLMKKLIGMTIFQVAIIILFIACSVKLGATVPTVDPTLSTADPELYANPLPHVLMLTAIVVMVATSGVALAILLLIYRRYHSLDETEIMKRMQE